MYRVVREKLATKFHNFTNVNRLLANRTAAQYDQLLA